MNSNCHYQLKFTPRGNRGEHSRGIEDERKPKPYQPKMPINNLHWRNPTATELEHNGSRASSRGGHTDSSTEPYRYSTGSDRYNEYMNQQPAQTQTRIDLLIEERQLQQKRKKNEILQRVKQLQEKVLPMVDAQRMDDEDNGFAFRAKVQQKISKLETAIDSLRKQLELEMERKLRSLDSRMEEKYKEIVRTIGNL